MALLLDDLEKGLVASVRHPGDRRAFLIEPADAGWSAQRQTLEALDQYEQRYLAVFSEREEGQLRRLLARLDTR